MTPESFKARRLALGLTQPQLAVKLGVKNRITLYRWETGISPVPRAVELALQTMRARKTRSPQIAPTD